MKIVLICLTLLVPVTVYGECWSVEYAELKDTDTKILKEKSVEYLEQSKIYLLKAGVATTLRQLAQSNQLISESSRCIYEAGRIKAVIERRGGKP